MEAESGTILRSVTRHYLTSRDFNGTPMREVDSDADTAKRLVADLLDRGLLSLNFGDRHPNSYVQALEPEPVAVQLDKLHHSTDLTHICMYPTPAHLKTVVGDNEYVDRPYTRRLALGEHLFVFVPFDLRVLEHYRNDPRYIYQTDDIQGHISVRGRLLSVGPNEGGRPGADPTVRLRLRRQFESKRHDKPVARGLASVSA